MRVVLLAFLLIAGAAALAQQPDPSVEEAAGEEAAVRQVIASWYAELGKRDAGRPEALVAPGFIDATPTYRHIDTGAAVLGLRVYTSLAATALRFAYDIDAMRIDATFAKVTVWERGYFYAFAAQTTYERAASALFVLERQEKDGRWLILAHRSDSVGIPPTKVTTPMPDLREHFYKTEGKLRDAEDDARGAGKF